MVRTDGADGTPHGPPENRCEIEWILFSWALVDSKRISWVDTRIFQASESEKTRKYAIESFSQEILLVKDSLDSALTIDNASLESYKNGVELTVKQLSTIFEKFNIEEIDPVGENFDPNFHQAMTMLDSEEEPNKIISVFQKGYKLNGRVLRPALVSVSKEKEKKAYSDWGF